jgi:hypothetical protein
MNHTVRNGNELENDHGRTGRALAETAALLIDLKALPKHLHRRAAHFSKVLKTEMGQGSIHWTTGMPLLSFGDYL